MPFNHSAKNDILTDPVCRDYDPCESLPDIEYDSCTANSIILTSSCQEIIDSITGILGKMSYTIETSSNEEGTLKAIERLLPDLIFLDIRLPDTNGFSLCQRIKENPEYTDIPIIFLTSLNDIACMVKAFRVGAADYITVPFHPDELIARAKTHLKLKHSLDRINEYSQLLENEIQLRNELAAELDEKNQLLEKHVLLDGMTGLYNHKFAIEKLSEEISNCQRSETPLSILMFDIDHFKQVNDTYGHQTGDEVIITIARGLMERIPGINTICRYGGEEFLIILPGTDANAVLSVAERIRMHIAEHVFHSKSDFTITISGGIATYRGESLNAFIDKADNLLYEAKRNGRNRIEHG